MASTKPTRSGRAPKLPGALKDSDSEDENRSNNKKFGFIYFPDERRHAVTSLNSVEQGENKTVRVRSGGKCDIDRRYGLTTEAPGACRQVQKSTETEKDDELECFLDQRISKRKAKKIENTAPTIGGSDVTRSDRRITPQPVTSSISYEAARKFVQPMSDDSEQIKVQLRTIENMQAQTKRDVKSVKDLLLLLIIEEVDVRHIRGADSQRYLYNIVSKVFGNNLIDASLPDYKGRKEKKALPDETMDMIHEAVRYRFKISKDEYNRQWHERNRRLFGQWLDDYGTRLNESLNKTTSSTTSQRRARSPNDSIVSTGKRQHTATYGSSNGRNEDEANDP
ncbi:unnamed protein product [Didymodactylos carnosus]|uniref:Uncharacterized protein n=1 Tax=Didymodactylos carnosus TaxID=1234261 RepID=A0A8S2E552_9BILA|nr:unnamed protein product [Didymodactylos carnosus]CAF3817555.1 unnamed protein product [Didymodactylos carnosus]